MLEACPPSFSIGWRDNYDGSVVRGFGTKTSPEAYKVQVCERRRVVNHCLNEYTHLLTGAAAGVWPTMWLTDGFGWLLASRYSDTPRRFTVVGIAALLGGLLWLAAALVQYIAPKMWEVICTLLALSCGLLLAGILRYCVWSENWKPVLHIISRIGESRIRYDMPEVVLLAIAWLVTLSSVGHGLFVGLPARLWDIGGTISMVRMFDFPAAVGIGSAPVARLVFLWLARTAVITAVLLRLSSCFGVLR